MSLRSKIILILTNDLQEINLLLGIFSVIINKIATYNFLPKFIEQILGPIIIVWCVSDYKIGPIFVGSALFHFKNPIKISLNLL